MLLLLTLQTHEGADRLRAVRGEQDLVQNIK